MSRRLSLLLLLFVSLALGSLLHGYLTTSTHYNLSGAPPYGEAETDVPTDLDPYSWIRDWQRPDGPARVGIQIGHLNSQDFPDELSRIRGNTGASGGGDSEVQVNTAIAQALKNDLESKGIQVDLLPATIPPDYWADVFIAIHADGNEDTSKSGYKFSGPWRDPTGQTDKLVSLLETEYAKITNLPQDPNISRNMRGYYAFAWWRYDHSIHPMTPGIIAETGFLTNPKDRKLIVDQPELVAQALGKALTTYLQQQKLI